MAMTAAQLAEHYKVHVATIGRAIEKYNLRASEEARMPKARGATYDDMQVAEIGKHITRLQVAPQPKAQVKTQVAQTQGANALQLAPQEDRKLHERILQLEAQVAQLQMQLAESRKAWGNGAKLIAKHEAKIEAHDSNFADAHNRMDFLDEWVSNLWYRLDHEPGTTDPRLRAAHLAQQRRSTADQIDEGGRETIERLEAEDTETSAFFAEMDAKRKVG